MPVTKSFVEGNVRTEIVDLRDGVGEHRSVDDILKKTGGGPGVYEEVGEDGTRYTYSVEVEEVRLTMERQLLIMVSGTKTSGQITINVDTVSVHFGFCHLSED